MKESLFPVTNVYDLVDERSIELEHYNRKRMSRDQIYPGSLVRHSESVPIPRLHCWPTASATDWNYFLVCCDGVLGNGEFLVSTGTVMTVLSVQLDCLGNYWCFSITDNGTVGYVMLSRVNKIETTSQKKDRR